MRKLNYKQPYDFRFRWRNDWLCTLLALGLPCTCVVRLVSNIGTTLTFDGNCKVLTAYSLEHTYRIQLLFKKIFSWNILMWWFQWSWSTWTRKLDIHCSNVWGISSSCLIPKYCACSLAPKPHKKPQKSRALCLDSFSGSPLQVMESWAGPGNKAILYSKRHVTKKCCSEHQCTHERV